ncbi:UV excision repair protein RAD23 homolog B isoform X4 [Procambarus clarkii]|uniref:UV excision repair protein RAD23 homolog B isoform X4 n=1 Tax=Procambarus clarkii TaxID=6728 RepID=UPI001E672341|nr:UV excision repair protein RAD23 homolog A-like isoform X2 [Procambarus clarkii]
MVVLTLKNLQQQTFTVEIELSATVRALKEKVEKEKGTDYPAVGQKLIYAGKILQDDTTLDSYNIDDKKFLVIMVTKPKAAAPPPGPADPTVIEEPDVASTQESTETSPSTSTPTTEASSEAASTSTTATTASSTSTTTTTTSTTTTTTTPPTEASTTPAAAPASQTTSGGSVGSAESLLVMGEEFNRMVENIMEMGYERSQVERALRASFNNPYTAVQYLVDGIPPNLDEPASNPAAGGEGEEQVAAEGDPDPDGVSTGGSGNQGSGGGSSGGGGSGGVSGRAVPGQNAILVSPQDRDAIERLKALGNFPEDVVIQAYFACEKNENLAAEFLFSQTWD